MPCWLVHPFNHHYFLATVCAADGGAGALVAGGGVGPASSSLICSWMVLMDVLMRSAACPVRLYSLFSSPSYTGTARNSTPRVVCGWAGLLWCGVPCRACLRECSPGHRTVRRIVLLWRSTSAESPAHRSSRQTPECASVKETRQTDRHAA